MATPPMDRKTTLDKDLKKLVRLEKATLVAGQSSARVGLAVLFLVGIWIVTAMQGEQGTAPFIIAAAVIGGYMAINIGANDVANNVGPAVGSKALTLTGAILIAAIFEAAGALIAGGDVVSTVKKGIIDIEQIPDVTIYIYAMMSALLAAALWLNLATYVGAPVSTTHSIVGGVMGAGIAAMGFDIVNWANMGKIAASWVISPMLGGLIAAAFLYTLKKMVIYQDDMLSAAKRWVPIVVAVMAAAFTMYLMLKGVKKLYKSNLTEVISGGFISFAIFYFLVRWRTAKKAEGLENSRKSVYSLFVIPLIISAALLSFAHGANDVANAIGPLAGIVEAVETGEITAKAGIPLWVMLVGALGIAVGLMLFGPRLIRTVGQEITKLNPMRAFCVALSAAITVIIASYMGLPVSSTHIAVGGIFGVGFLREYLYRKNDLRPSPLPSGHAQPAPVSKMSAEPVIVSDAEAAAVVKKVEKKARKRLLVRRQHLLTIAAAWVITVPVAAGLAAALYMMLNGVMQN